MTAVSELVRQRLANAGILLVAETESHFLFSRDNLLTLVERRGTGFGSIGSTGILTADGLAYLVRRDGREYLKSKGAEVAAEDGQLAAIRSFSLELESVLRQT